MADGKFDLKLILEFDDSTSVVSLVKKMQLKIVATNILPLCGKYAYVTWVLYG